MQSIMVAHQHNYSQLSQFEDIEIQWASSSDDENGGGRRAISQETQPDGAIVRQNETVLSNGETIVEECVGVLSAGGGRPLHAGIRLLPVTPAMFGPAKNKHSILPFHPKDISTKTNKNYCQPTSSLLSCLSCAGCTLIFFFIIQILLWYLVRTGQDLDAVWNAIFPQQLLEPSPQD